MQTYHAGVSFVMLCLNKFKAVCISYYISSSLIFDCIKQELDVVVSSSIQQQ